MSAEFERFWNFSVRTYRSDGVPEASLSLQNDYGADVNMLLYCCWVGVVAGRFDGDLFARASQFSTLWANHVVIPLRSSRTWMKHSGCAVEPMQTDACMELRDGIKSVEFEAEKLQQEALQSLLSVSEPRALDRNQILSDMKENLKQYATYASFDVCSDVETKFNVVIDAALAG